MVQSRQDSMTAIFLAFLWMVGFEGGVCMQRAGAQETQLWKPRPLASGETTLPDRIAQADLVVLGRVSAIENKSFEAQPFPGSADQVAYRVLGMKSDEILLGEKAAGKIRVGFLLQYTPLAPLPQASVIEMGREGLFFLKKHHEGDFYVNFSLNNGIPRGAPEFAKSLEDARKMTRILQDPVAALQGDHASNRYLAVVMLIRKFRPPPVKGQQRQEVPIDAQVSKLLLKALAEADWNFDKDWLFAPIYPAHPYHVFQQLGVTKADGYQPPTDDLRDTLAATQKWLRDHQEKYTVKRFTSKSK